MARSLFTHVRREGHRPLSVEVVRGGGAAAAGHAGSFPWGTPQLLDPRGSLGYSYHTIQNIIDLFVGYFLVRRLEPYHANISKRLVKAPKVYLRDSGVLHCLLGVSTADELLTSPGRGNSFEGFMIQQILALEELRRPGSGAYFFRTHAGAEIDLLIDRGSERIGLEFKAGVATDATDWKHLLSGIDDGVIHRGLVVYNGSRAFEPHAKISVVPATQILASGLD